MSISRLFERVAILLAIWIASIPAAELAFRVLGDQPSEDLEGLYVPFVNGSYKLARGIDTAATWAAGHFSVCTDKLGLRCDRSRELAINPGARVTGVVLGDSQGFGNGVDFEESVAGVMAGLAWRDGVHFVNASVGGHAGLNQLAVACWLRDDQHVSATTYILLATPLMIRYPESFTRSVVGPDGRIYESPMRVSARARIWLKTHAVIYNRCRDALRNCGFDARAREDADQVFQLYGAGATLEAVREKFAAFLQGAKNFAEASGARLIVVYVPLTVEADFDAMRMAAAKRNIILDPDLPSRACAEATAGLGIPMHDLRPVLNDLRAQGDPLRLKGDFHYDRALSAACGTFLWSNIKPQLQRNEPAISSRQRRIMYEH